MTFQLHPRLQQDSVYLGRFKLCQLRLMNDSQYPWFILIPEVPNLSEIYQLTSEHQQQLIQESSYLAEHLATQYQADKMNIANIGNIVNQLHIHHVVRYQHDPCFPAPIWGKLPVIPYTDEQLSVQIQRVMPLLQSYTNT